MAKKEKTNKSSSGLRFKTKLLLFIGLIGSIVLLKQSTMFMLVGLLPAIVALIVDTTPKKSWAKAVFCFNFAGILPPLLNLVIAEGNSPKALQLYMGDMSLWLQTYSAAGMAWVFIWLNPIIAEKLLRFYHQARIEKHQKKLQQIDEEWNVATIMTQSSQ
jgi:hypothetical protein